MFTDNVLSWAVFVIIISGEKEKFWFRGESRKKALERKPTVEEFLKVSGFFHLIVKGLSYLESVWSFSKGFG